MARDGGGAVSGPLSWARNLSHSCGVAFFSPPDRWRKSVNSTYSDEKMLLMLMLAFVVSARADDAVGAFRSGLQAFQANGPDALLRAWYPSDTDTELGDPRALDCGEFALGAGDRDGGFRAVNFGQTPHAIVWRGIFSTATTVAPGRLLHGRRHRRILGAGVFAEAGQYPSRRSIVRAGRLRPKLKTEKQG